MTFPSLRATRFARSEAISHFEKDCHVAAMRLLAMTLILRIQNHFFLS